MSTVGFIRRMVAAGFSYEDAMVAAEAFEAEVHDLTPVKSSGAVRQARYMAKKRHSASQNDASDASLDKEVSPTPPSRNLSLVTPPYSPPPTGGDTTSEDKTEVGIAQPSWGTWVDRAWQVVSAAGRQRTSRKDVETALKAAANRGHDPAVIISGLDGYFRSHDATKENGKFAKGAHRVIQNDRWMAFVEPAKPEQTPQQQAEDREAWWGRRVAEYVKSRHWNEVDWGPRPGREGCHVPSQILESNGFSRMEMVG